MKVFKISILALMIATCTTSCRKDDTQEVDTPVDTPVDTALEVKTVENLNATHFIKFSFSTGDKVDPNSDNWDIAMYKTYLFVNGGSKYTTQEDEPDRTGNGAGYIVNGTLESVTSVDTAMLKQDALNELAIPKGSGLGVYNYNMTTHIISPIPNKVLVFRTHDGKYAKMVITNYYKDKQDTDYDQFGYYHFDYVYQPDGSTF